MRIYFNKENLFDYDTEKILEFSQKLGDNKEQEIFLQWVLKEYDLLKIDGEGLRVEEDGTCWWTHSIDREKIQRELEYILECQNAKDVTVNLTAPPKR